MVCIHFNTTNTFMKIFDIVFFYNEHQLLNRRIEYLKKVVNHTIVLNFGGDHIENDFVTVIPVLEHFDEFKKKRFVKMIINFIGKKNVSYKDKFIFSKTFEIPSVEILEKFTILHTQGPIILDQTTYTHKITKKSLYKNIGCALCSYSDLLLHPHVEALFFENKSSFFDRENLLQGGYCLLNFYDCESSLLSLKYWFPEYTQNLTLEVLKNLRGRNQNILSYERPHVLINTINKDLRIFDYENDYFQQTKKIYITFFYEKDIPDIYDEVVYISENNIEIEGINTWFVKKPLKIYYKSKNYFDDYKKNDILRCLRSLNLNNEDEIHIKTKTVGSPTVFEYKDLKDSIPSEII